MQPVDVLGRDLNGGVETEGVVGAGKVVVDGLGHAHHVERILAMQLVGHAQRIVAADGDGRPDLVLPQVVDQQLDAAFVLHRIGARGSQDGAAAMQDAGYGVEIKRHVIVVQQPAPAAARRRPSRSRRA